MLLGVVVVGGVRLKRCWYGEFFECLTPAINIKQNIYMLSITWVRWLSHLINVICFCFQHISHFWHYFSHELIKYRPIEIRPNQIYTLSIARYRYNLVLLFCVIHSTLMATWSIVHAMDWVQAAKQQRKLSALQQSLHTINSDACSGNSTKLTPN